MTAASIAGLVVLGLGVVMVLAGTVMNIFDWQTARARQRHEEIHVETQNLADSISALSKLVRALKGSSQGTQLIVLGIVILLIGAALLGFGSL